MNIKGIPTNEWLCECVNECQGILTNDWVSEWKNEWMDVNEFPANKWMNGFVLWQPDHNGVASVLRNWWHH